MMIMINDEYLDVNDVINSDIMRDEGDVLLATEIIANILKVRKDLVTFYLGKILRK